MPLKNYYDLLGITSTASQEDIKKAYRKLSLKFHPDKNDGDAFLMDMFKTINEANEILSNPESRGKYDSQLKSAEEVKNRTDFNQAPTEQTTTHTDSDKVERVYDLWNLYLEKKKRTDKAYGNLVAVRSHDEPRYVTTKKVLSSLLALLLVWLFFKPTANSEVTNSGATSKEWVTVEPAKVYKKPNIQSKVVGELPVGQKVEALDETNYFLKINFVNSGGKSSKAYVMKLAMSKNQ